ncbi:MAG TPA: hypothetical protein VHW23_11205 [Kofleriaceae bacterium]|jgi:hypothetical protein|nr:hypothetical protein [Kofleriaceae bacterium]
MTWLDAPVERRPIVVVEDHLYHTGELVDAVAALRPALVGQITAIALDRAGPDTDAAIADCRRQHPALCVVAPTADDLRDAAACARLAARLLRPGGLLVQDVQLTTLPFVPADRWWESIYLAATVRGLYADRPPQVRFLSNKRGYAATFGRDLADAGFDPRDVMDKAALEASVAPTLARFVDTAFPMALTVSLCRARSGDRRTWRASAHDAERRELSAGLDLLVWADPAGWELGGRLVQRDAGARGSSGLLALRPGHEAASWLALVTDRLDRGDGLPVVAVGERVGPPGVERAEATNLAARHVHTLRGRLRDPGAIVTAHHAYRLRDDLDVGVCRPATER